MKKLLLSLSALILLGMPKISAQLINPNFTTWSVDILGANDPNGGLGTSGWWDFNFDHNAALGSSPTTVFEGTTNPAPVSPSTHYAAIISAPMTPSTYGTLSPYMSEPDTNGLLFTAYINIVGASVTFKAGEAWSGGRSPRFSFYYRYIPKGIDTCSCAVAMYHFNTVNHTRELIGGGYWSSPATQSTWTQVNVPITYDSASVPDTIYVQFSACSTYKYGKPKSGDTLDIDNTNAVLGVGNITEQHDNVSLYPNPANNAVSLSVTGQFRAAAVEVYDITGRSVGAYQIHNNFLTINTQSYTTGLYIYKLLDDSGNQLNVGKFNVVK